MFDRGRFNQTAFNLAGSGEPTFYATITSQYGAEVMPIRALVRISAVSLNAETQLKIGNLGLYTRLPEVVLAGESGVLPNFTARVPLGGVLMVVWNELSTLMDDVLLGWHEIGNRGVYTSSVLRYILDRQTVPRWQLGRCEFSHQYLYGWENENLLSALFSVPSLSRRTTSGTSTPPLHPGCCL